MVQVEQAADAAVGIRTAAPMTKATTDAIFISKLPESRKPDMRR
jgi:hypothetical protein